MTLLVRHYCGCGGAGAGKSSLAALDATARNRRDPTGTGRIRAAYVREMTRRFRKLKAEMRHVLVELDVLGLRRSAAPGTTSAAQAFLGTFTRTRDGTAAQRRSTVDAAPPPAGAFAARSSGGKVAAFSEWMYQAERDGVLQVQSGTPMQAAAQQSWQNTYIESAYKTGVKNASEAMQETNAAMSGEAVTGAFNTPMHADRVGIIYTQAYRDLEGVTDAMDAAISRALAQGLTDGSSPEQIARAMAKQIDGIGLTRARLIAQTETIRAHAEGALNEYAQAGIDGVVVLAEFTTAGDDQVCPECDALGGEVYTIERARGVIPVHPRCRCAWLPSVQDPPEGVTTQ